MHYSQDLREMCRLLGLEDSVNEVTAQLGIGGDQRGGGAGRITFDDFVRARARLAVEIEGAWPAREIRDVGEQRGKVLSSFDENFGAVRPCARSSGSSTSLQGKLQSRSIQVLQSEFYSILLNYQILRRNGTNCS